MNGFLSLQFAVFFLGLATASFAADDECVKCHPAVKQGTAVHKALENGCQACHNDSHAKGKGELSLVNDEPDLCIKCHENTVKPAHTSKDKRVCSGCHNPHSSNTASLLLEESETLCYRCHDSGQYLKKKVVHNPVTTGMCTFCHPPHFNGVEGKMLMMDLPDLCFNCHDSANYSGKKRTTHFPVEAGMCTFCHNPHATDNLFRLEKPINDMCLTCHDNPNISSGRHVIMGVSQTGHPLKGRPDPLRKGRSFACSSCHNPHGSNSVRMFRYAANVPFDVCRHCHKK